ncbi:cation-transporting P-type ATPase [Flavobacterium sp. DSP2-3-1]|uniref:cation-transporting P-type ATPase n=1 Tax=Flavobacterium sp. DSP2-3-1 TaxID=2804620 RepID=UPI003CF1BCD4
MTKLLITTPSGLDEVMVSNHFYKHGENQREDTKEKTVLQMILSQVFDFIILILIAAAIIAGTVMLRIRK